MPNLTIELEETTYAALTALAKEQGLASPEQLLAHQVDSLLAVRNGQGAGQGVNPELSAHLEASIRENQGLLERLAK